MSSRGGKAVSLSMGQGYRSCPSDQSEFLGSVVAYAPRRLEAAMAPMEYNDTWRRRSFPYRDGPSNGDGKACRSSSHCRSRSNSDPLKIPRVARTVTHLTSMTLRPLSLCQEFLRATTAFREFHLAHRYCADVFFGVSSADYSL